MQSFHQMCATLLWWRHLVNACEVKAGIPGKNLAPSVSGSLPHPC